MPVRYTDATWKKGLSDAESLIRRAISDLERRQSSSTDSQSTPLQLVEQLCDRFHLIARQLRARHDDRSTLDINDEYDVQDLLHSLLWLYFDDVRAEEATPSHAGKSSRVDFLIKAEQLVIEVKKTRPGLTAKEVGSQLIDDIERYQSHADCKALVCFVYDPDGRVTNPRGLETDLSRDEPIKVRVYIRPK